MATMMAPTDPAKIEEWTHEVATMLRVLADRVEHEQDLYPVKLSHVDSNGAVSSVYNFATMEVAITFIPRPYDEEPRKENES